jgi:hypothetical protein
MGNNIEQSLITNVLQYTVCKNAHIYYTNYLTVYCFLRVLAAILLSVKISWHSRKITLKWS